MIDSAMTPSGGLSREDMAAALAAASTDDLELELAPAPDVTDAGLEIDLNALDPALGAMADQTALDALADLDDTLLPDIPHNGNLAAALSEQVRNQIVQDVFAAVSSDDTAREEWVKMYRHALKLLGFTFETVSEPWEGAASSVHPMLAAATVSFQARSIKTLFPASGPVKSRILGPSTPHKQTAVARAVEALNNQLTTHLDYRVELEKALFTCGFAGSGFIKTWKDDITRRAMSYAIAPEDLILSPDAADVTSAARVTHILRKPRYEVQELVARGVYIDVLEHIAERSPHEGGHVSTLSSADIDDERSAIGGVDSGQDQRVTLHEVYLRLTLGSFDEQYAGWDNPDGIPRPYVLTYDAESMQMLGLYRNWEETDASAQPLQPITQYQYLVSHLSPYGIGLMHLIGQTTENVTAIQRNLTDAGTLANLQAGYKSRGLRTREENVPLRPGEFRDVDVSSGKIADNIYQLQFKEPSPTLLALMNGMIETGQALSALASTSLEDLPHNAASFAVLAVLEREIEPQAAVHIRMHASFSHQLRQIVAITAELTPDYPYDVDGDGQPGSAEPGLLQRDFTMAEFVPVSNPNEASAGTKLLKAEVLKQLAQAYPDQFNQTELVRYMVQMLDEPDFARTLKQETKPPYLDPISENMSLMTGKPVMAYLEQDHEAHIKVHMSAMQDPSLQAMMANNPNSQAMMAAANAHLMEHMAYGYRRQMERQLGIQLPPLGQELPPEQEVRLSYIASDAAEKLLGLHQKEQALKAAEDPVFKLQQQEVANETRKLDIDERDKIARNKIEGAKVIIEAAKADKQFDLDQFDLGVKVLSAAQKANESNYSRGERAANAERAAQQPPAARPGGKK